MEIQKHKWRRWVEGDQNASCTQKKKKQKAQITLVVNKVSKPGEEGGEAYKKFDWL